MSSIVSQLLGLVSVTGAASALTFRLVRKALTPAVVVEYKARHRAVGLSTMQQSMAATGLASLELLREAKAAQLPLPAPSPLLAISARPYGYHATSLVVPTGEHTLAIDPTRELVGVT